MSVESQAPESAAPESAIATPTHAAPVPVKLAVRLPLIPVRFVTEGAKLHPVRVG